MASIKQIAKGRSDLYRVSINDLAVKEGWNSRILDDPENIEHIDMLAKSIAEEGVKQPLTVYMEDGKLYIEDGHCRYFAVQKAITDYDAPADLLIPVRMGEKDATEADRIFSQILRNSGKPLSPLEMASVFKRLVDLGWSDSEIARKAGVTRVYVGHLITLIEAPKEIIALVRSGLISATLAIETIKEYGDRATELLKAAVALAIEKGKTKATKKHVKEVAGEDKKVEAESESQDDASEAVENDAEGEGGDSANTEEADSEPKEKRPNLKKELRSIFRNAEVHENWKGDKGLVGLFITAEEYERITALLGIEDDEEELI